MLFRSLLSPTGATLATVVQQAYQIAPVELDVASAPSSGTYRLVIDPWDAATGTWPYRIAAITEAVVEIPADGATRTIVTTVPGERIHRTFHAATGRRLYAWVTSPETGTSGVLLAPDTTTLASASGSGKKAYGLEVASSPADGTYRIDLDPAGTNVGSFTLSVSEIEIGRAHV